MKKIIISSVICALLLSSGCAGVPANNDVKAPITKEEFKSQTASVNVLDTLLGAGVGLLVGGIAGGAIMLISEPTSWWFVSPDARFYVPVFTCTIGGGVLGWLLSPKAEENSKIK